MKLPYIFLSLISFTWNNYFEIHSCCLYNNSWYLLEYSSYGHTTVYPFICWWTDISAVFSSGHHQNSWILMYVSLCEHVLSFLMVKYQESNDKVYIYLTFKKLPNCFQSTIYGLTICVCVWNSCYSTSLSTLILFSHFSLAILVDIVNYKLLLPLGLATYLTKLNHVLLQLLLSNTPEKRVQDGE